MLFKTSIFIDTLQDASFVEPLIKLKLGIYKETEYLVCKKCKAKKPISNIDLSDEFWECQNSHSNSIKHVERKIEKQFIWDFNAVNKAIKNKLEEISQVSDKNSHWIISTINGKLPVTVIDSPLTSGAHILLNNYDKGVLLLYLFESSKKEFQNIFISENFISVSNFLTQNIDEIRKKLCSVQLSHDVTKLIDAEDEIEQIKNYEEFEIKVNSILNNLKKEETKLKNLLSVLQKNKNNILGSRFVHIGSNYPTDIEPIELYTYIDKFLEIDKSTGYDAKWITTNLTYGNFKKKLETNPGKRLIFITSAKNVEGTIWKRIIDAQKNNKGEWYHIVIDFEILSLLWAYLLK